MTVAYDAGFLVAVERGDRVALGTHFRRMQNRDVPITTAPVIAQVSRSTRQVRMRRLLLGCRIVDFAVDDAHEVGALLARANTADVVDAHLVLVASRLNATVLTSDLRDLERLAAHIPGEVRVVAV